MHPLLGEIERSVAEYQGPTGELLRIAVGVLYRNMVDSEEMRELIRLLIAEGPRIPDVRDYFSAKQ